MNKFKIEHSAGQNFLVIQGQKGQQISQREYYAISTGQIPSLLRAELVQKGNTFKLVYNISGLISLKDFLLNPLNKRTFTNLLTNILNNLKNLQSAYYNHQYILMDVNAAMVSPTTQQVSFVYVPITFYESGTSMKEFLLGIIQCCSFAPGENTDYVREYIRILNAGINFSVFDLEEFIKKLTMDGQGGMQIKKCTRCGTSVPPNVNFCSSCGMKISGLKIENNHGIYDMKSNIHQEIQKEDVSRPRVDRLGETISGSVFEARKAFLTRCKNGERIAIVGEQFVIGKDPYNCNYFINDNPAVSRRHAVIKYANGIWVINDLKSTNKTYINDRELAPGVDVELVEGTRVTLGNENFIFNLYE